MDVDEFFLTLFGLVEVFIFWIDSVLLQLGQAFFEPCLRTEFVLQVVEYSSQLQKLEREYFAKKE